MPPACMLQLLCVPSPFSLAYLVLETRLHVFLRGERRLVMAVGKALRLLLFHGGVCAATRTGSSRRGDVTLELPQGCAAGSFEMRLLQCTPFSLRGAAPGFAAGALGSQARGGVGWALVGFTPLPPLMPLAVRAMLLMRTSRMGLLKVSASGALLPFRRSFGGSVTRRPEVDHRSVLAALGLRLGVRPVANAVAGGKGRARHRTSLSQADVVVSAFAAPLSAPSLIHAAHVAGGRPCRAELARLEGVRLRRRRPAQLPPAGPQAPGTSVARRRASAIFRMHPPLYLDASNFAAPWGATAAHTSRYLPDIVSGERNPHTNSTISRQRRQFASKSKSLALKPREKAAKLSYPRAGSASPPSTSAQPRVDGAAGGCSVLQTRTRLVFGICGVSSY